MNTRVIAVAVALAACTQADTPLTLESGATAEVEDVVKGDEIAVESDGKSARVRMLGVHAFAAVIDDPKIKELETKAKDWLNDEVAGKSVRVVLGAVPQDSHGRYLGYVEIAGNDINRSLIEQGRAVVYTEYPFEREAAYLTAEGTARRKKAGVWATESAAKLVKGLRKQWRDSRKDPGFIDPLLNGDPDAVTKEDVPKE